MLDRLLSPFLDYWYWAQERGTPLTRGLALIAPLLSFALVLYLLFGRGGDGSALDVDPTAGIAAGTQAPAATQPAASNGQPVTEPGATGTATADETPGPEPTAFEQQRYTVVEGDTPFGIAEKVGVPAELRAAWVEELLALNGVTETTIQIGQELILPPF